MELLAALLLGGFLGFNALATPKRVAKGAEKALRQSFPGADVEVRVTGRAGGDVVNGRFKTVHISLAHLRFDAPPDSAKAEPTSAQPAPAPSVPPAFAPLGKAPKVKVGRVGHLEVEVRDVRAGSLEIDHARLSLDEVRYDFGALKKRSEMRLLSFTNGKIFLGVKTASLTPFFAARTGDAKNLAVAFNGGEISITGDHDVLGNPTPFQVRGPLVLRGSRFEVDNPRVTLSGAPLPPALAASTAKDINPLFDFDPKGQSPIKLEIRALQTRGDILEMEGALALK